MTRGHERGRPERDDEAEINRVANQFVEQRHLEARLRHRLAGEVVGNLCRPNSSKWLIRKVLASTISQPIASSAMSTVAAAGLLTCQTTAGIGRHCQYSKSSRRLAART